MNEERGKIHLCHCRSAVIMATQKANREKKSCLSGVFFYLSSSFWSNCPRYFASVCIFLDWFLIKQILPPFFNFASGGILICPLVQYLTLRCHLPSPRRGLICFFIGKSRFRRKTLKMRRLLSRLVSFWIVIKANFIHVRWRLMRE